METVMTYSYDVTELNNESVSRMRFELGDTLFNPAELTAALSDEEYAAVISESSSWKKAKISCIKAILMKYAHQTTTTVGPVSYDFSQRVEQWRKLLDDIKSDMSSAVPLTINNIGGRDGEKPYFHTDMQINLRKV